MPQWIGPQDAKKERKRKKELLRQCDAKFEVVVSLVIKHVVEFCDTMLLFIGFVLHVIVVFVQGHYLICKKLRHC